MKTIDRKCFPKAVQVADRFHLQKLALETIQDIRIKHRWDAIDLENEAIKKDRLTNQTYKPQLLVMVILENNSWQEVDICYTKHHLIGLKINMREVK